MARAVNPRVLADPHWTQVLGQLIRLQDAGVDAQALFTAAAGEQDLPDDQPAAAIWWRMTRHLPPALVQEVTAPPGTTALAGFGSVEELLRAASASAAQSARARPGARRDDETGEGPSTGQVGPTSPDPSTQQAPERTPQRPPILPPHTPPGPDRPGRGRGL